MASICPRGADARNANGGHCHKSSVYVNVGVTHDRQNWLRAPETVWYTYGLSFQPKGKAVHTYVKPSESVPQKGHDTGNKRTWWKPELSSSGPW